MARAQQQLTLIALGREEKSRALRDGVIRPLHRMALDVRVAEDLKVVAARERLVAEEVDLIVPHALDVAQAVRLIPALQQWRRWAAVG